MTENKELSGASWVTRFPTSKSLNDLSAAFRIKVQSFTQTLRRGGATFAIAATYRPPERAYLMHWSYRITEGFRADQVPAMTGVPIDWCHRRPDGSVDAARSVRAAQAMVDGYDIVFAPALASRHTERRAVDMSIGGYLSKSFEDARGESTLLRSEHDLYSLGRSFGVIKLLSDRPHWSDDGR